MQCPSCKSYQLKPTKLEYGLPAVLCTKCHGVLISLLSYRDWAERNKLDKGTAKLEVKAKEIPGIMLCPKCNRLMTKFNISGEHKNKIDFCNSCDEAWLDDGEWKLLKYLKLEGKLASVFTEPWQQNLKKEAASKSKEQRARETFKDDFSKISEFKVWIKNKKSYKHIMKYLHED